MLDEYVIENGKVLSHLNFSSRLRAQEETEKPAVTGHLTVVMVISNKLGFPKGFSKWPKEGMILDPLSGLKESSEKASGLSER